MILAAGEAANAGAIFGLEISQNTLWRSRERDEIDDDLRFTMEHSTTFVPMRPATAAR